MLEITKMIINHIELVEVLKEHKDYLDSFVDDESNWILDEGDIYQPKTGELADKWNALSIVVDQQEAAIASSHETISQVASNWEDSGTTNAYIDALFAQFFKEFGV